MAPDPFTAVSLASSVIQFVDFGTKLITKGHEIRHSAEGTTERHFELGLISARLTTLSANLHNAMRMKASSSHGLTDDERTLMRLAEASQSVSEKLASALEALKIQRPNDGKWSGLRATLKHCWGQEKIQELETRLDSLRKQLAMQLLLSMRDGQNTLGAAIQALALKTRRADADRKAQLDRIAQDIGFIREKINIDGQGFDKERLTDFVEQMLEPRRSLQSIRVDPETLLEMRKMQENPAGPTLDPSKVISLDPLGTAAFHMRTIQGPLRMVLDPHGIEQGPSQGFNEHQYNLQLIDHIQRVSDLTVCASDVAAENRILKSLSFATMKSRHQAIPEAHVRTSNWIFKRNSKAPEHAPSASGRFVEWLKTKNDIFWVSGKAGSGKSTLMKFICSHEMTRRHLRAWAGDNTLVLANYFFWNVGSPMQKSVQGLLQSLVSRILRQCPKLIQIACPSRWTPQADFATEQSWSVSELLETMERIQLQSEIPARFCFFIDGLDEYDGYHREVVDVMRSLCKHPNVKICVSSRPWNVFEDAFGGEVFKFYLHELTKQDIELYVKEKLKCHPKFVTSAVEDPEYIRLVQDTVDQSQGVFLWVYLVVRSLYDGLDNCDSLAILNARLKSIPADLKQFFQKIIDSIDPVYTQSLAESFSIAVHADEPQPLMLFSVLDTFLHGKQVKPFRLAEVTRRKSNMKRQINGRSKGLLECQFNPNASEFWSYRVEFLHRTLRDYLQQEAMESFLKNSVAKNFNPYLTLSIGYARLFQVLPYAEEQQTKEDACTIRANCNKAFHYMRIVEQQIDHSDDQTVHHLRDLVSSLAKRRSISTTPYLYILGIQRELSSMIEYATVYGLTSYVQEELRKDPLISIRRDLLSLVHEHIRWQHPDNEDLIQCMEITKNFTRRESMISVIAKHNASPAVWIYYLMDLSKAVDSSYHTSYLSEASSKPANPLTSPQSITCLGRVLEFKPDPRLISRFSERLWPMILGSIADLGMEPSFPDLQDYYATVVKQLILDKVCKLDDLVVRDDFQFILKSLGDAPRQEIQAAIDVRSTCDQSSKQPATGTFAETANAHLDSVEESTDPIVRPRVKGTPMKAVAMKAIKAFKRLSFGQS